MFSSLSRLSSILSFIHGEVEVEAELEVVGVLIEVDSWDGFEVDSVVVDLVEFRRSYQSLVFVDLTLDFLLMAVLMVYLWWWDLDYLERYFEVHLFVDYQRNCRNLLFLLHSEDFA